MLLICRKKKSYFRHKTRAKGSTRGTEKQYRLLKLGFKIGKEYEKSFHESFITSWYAHFLTHLHTSRWIYPIDRSIALTIKV